MDTTASTPGAPSASGASGASAATAVVLDAAAEAPQAAEPARKPTRAERRAARNADPDHVPFGKNVAWNLRGLSMAANVLILGYYSIYATDTLGLSPALLGSLLMASKIFDGFTDLVAGYLIDRTHTRWGRARPYEFMLVGVWLCTWLLFSTPDMSTTGKAIWVFVMYSLVNSIFGTFANINQTLYTALAFPTRVAMSRVMAFGGVLISYGAIVIAVVVPIGLSWAGKDSGRWSTFLLAFSAVFLVMGLARFLFVKETVVQAADTMEKVTFREIFAMLRDNRYIWILLIVGAIGAVGGNLGAGAYYFRYIVGNLGLQSVTAAIGIVIVPAILVLPRLMKRFQLSRIVLVSQLIAAAGNALNYFAHGNIVFLVITTAIVGIGTLPLSYMSGIFLIDCSTYNEYRGHRRLESIMGAIQSFAGKIGGGIGVWIAGLVLGAAGYDGTLDVQSDSAINAITALFSWVPALFLVAVAIGYRIFDLDLRLPQINAELEQRRAETVASAHAETATAATTAEAGATGASDATAAAPGAHEPGTH